MAVISTVSLKQCSLHKFQPIMFCIMSVKMLIYSLKADALKQIKIRITFKRTAVLLFPFSLVHSQHAVFPSDGLLLCRCRKKLTGCCFFISSFLLHTNHSCDPSDYEHYHKYEVRSTNLNPHRTQESFQYSELPRHAFRR